MMVQAMYLYQSYMTITKDSTIAFLHGEAAEDGSSIYSHSNSMQYNV